MIAPIQLQCIFSYAILANPELEPHAPNTYQSKLRPGGSINHHTNMRGTRGPCNTVKAAQTVTIGISILHQ